MVQTPHSSTEQWRRLESLFDQAVALPVAERAAFLHARCGDDESLRARLRHMLASDDHQGLLDQSALPAAGGAPVELACTLIGRRVGDYQVRSVIASGGMGTVYEAQQENPSRLVALKVMSAALVSPDAVRRFQFEAETLARLQHPAIAAIYESGVFADDAAPHGRPFFAMELVHGRPLTQFASAHALDLGQRVDLLIRVCEGVEHAHSRGVIHRDLKPANILVQADRLKPVGPTPPQPKILDFGIARLIDSRGNLTMHTVAGQVLGTLAYMSPEQVSGNPAQVDVRSDVYALGVIAYELLGGRTPHDLTTASMAHAARVITERDPVALGALDRQCRGDLETVVAKALEKDPDRRYQSASQLAEDFRRYLADEPIAARRASRLYQLRKFARRNRVLVGGIIAVFVVLALGVAATTWQWRHAVSQRNAAQLATGRAQDAEQLARQRLQQTQDVVWQMLEHADKQLADLPGGALARERVASTALQRIAAIVEGRQDGLVDPSTLNTLAYAYQRVAEAQLAIGRSADALVHEQQALRIRVALVADHPDDTLQSRSLAVEHWKIAEPLIVMGRLDEALAHNLEALRLIERVAASGKDSVINGLIYRGMAHRRVAGVDALAGRHDIAIQRLEQAIALLDEAVAMDPEQWAARRTRATAWRSMGDSLAAIGEIDRGIDCYEASIAQIEALLIKAGTANAFETIALTRARVSLALGLARADQAARARETIDVAIGPVARLASADPAGFEAQHLHTWCTLHSGELFRLGDRLDEARTAYINAAELLLRLIESDPANALARADAAVRFARLGDVLLEAKDQSERRSAAMWYARAATLIDDPLVRSVLPTSDRALANHIAAQLARLQMPVTGTSPSQ